MKEFDFYRTFCIYILANGTKFLGKSEISSIDKIQGVIPAQSQNPTALKSRIGGLLQDPYVEDCDQLFSAFFP